jgi:hypothetical protein
VMLIEILLELVALADMTYESTYLQVNFGR